MRPLACYLVLACLLLLFNAPNFIVAYSLRRHVTGPAPDLATYRRAGCDNFSSNSWQPLRPGYHITVPYGWLNDPHGMFELKGTTHVIMQYNPKAMAWGTPFWAHVVSRDLAHWTWLPPALLPDTPYDFNGVLAGSATVPEESGVPVLTYTAAGALDVEAGNFFQTQAVAVPHDMAGDPLLKRWRKHRNNPVLSQPPPGGSNVQFRDPTDGRHAVWRALTSPHNPHPLSPSSYALAIGFQAHCLGGSGIFTASDMAGPWRYVGNLCNQLSIEGNVEPEMHGQHLARRAGVAAAARVSGPGAAPPSCDQFGAYRRMWEVVDFLELEPGVWMLKWDDQSSFRGLFSMEWYVLGNGPWDYSALNPPNVTNNTVIDGADDSADNDSVADNTSCSGGTSCTSGSAGLGGSSCTACCTASSVFGQQYSSYRDVTFSSHAAMPASRQQQQQQQQQQHQDDFEHAAPADDAAVRRGLFRGELDGQKYAPLRTDYGSVYASMTYRTSDGRQVMFGWIRDTAAGCWDSCSEQLPAVIAQLGFKGALTLPRALSYDQATKTLRAYPVKETALLRGALAYNASLVPVATLPGLTPLVPVGVVNLEATNATSSSNSSSGGSNAGSRSRDSSAAEHRQSTARQFEVQLNFTLLPPGQQQQQQRQQSAASSNNNKQTTRPSEFAVGVRILTGHSTYTDVFLNGSLAVLQPGSATSGSSNSSSSSITTGTAPNNMSKNMSYNITSLSVWVDRSRAGGATNTSFVEGGPVPLPVTVTNSVTNSVAVPQGKLGLSVWVDHSVVEVYALGGLARVTSRIYPEGNDVAWGLAAWATAPTMNGAVGIAGAAMGNAGAADGWGVLLDGQVWSVENAWLPPDC